MGPAGAGRPDGIRAAARNISGARRGGLRAGVDAFTAFIGRLSIARLLAAWLLITVGFGVAEWLLMGTGGGLRSPEGAVARDAAGLRDALYFSLVTALSIGYGDVVPTGSLRLLAVLEGAAGLLIFGSIISKLVSRRQEELTEEIHRITFDDRLGRVRTNLHLVISKMQDIAEACNARGTAQGRMMTRVESATAIFAGEMRTVHDLLYRPQETPDEDVLEAILAGLWAGLRELAELRRCMGGDTAMTPGFHRNVHAIGALAEQICGDCVPREYAPDLTGWMDRIQELATSMR